MNPEFIQPRGAQRQAIMLAREWARMGHDVRLFSGGKKAGYEFDDLLAALPPVETTEPWETYVKHGGTLPGSNIVRVRHTRRVLRGLGERLDAERFDVVNAHNHPAQWLAQFLKGPRLVWTCNEPPVWYYYPTLRNKWDKLFPLMHDRSNAAHLHAIAVLDRVMAARTRSGYPHAPIHVVGSGCELPGALPPRDAALPADLVETAGAPGFHALAVLGGLSKQKRPGDVLEAVIASGIPDATLHLIASDALGEGARLKARAAQAGVRLDWRPSVSEAHLLHLYARSDAALFLPENQPWGIFPLEALLAGIPVVLSDEVGALEALQRERPYPRVAKVGDVAAAAAHLRAIHADPKAARAEAAEFQGLLRREYSWQACAKRYLDVFRAAGV